MVEKGSICAYLVPTPYRPTFSGELKGPTFSGELKRHTFSGELKRPTFSGELKRPTFSGELKRPTFSGELKTVNFLFCNITIFCYVHFVFCYVHFCIFMHMADCIAIPDDVSSKVHVSVQKSVKYVMLYILKIYVSH